MRTPTADVIVTHRSRGVVLVVGDGPEVLEPARRLAAIGLKAVAFAPGLQAAGRRPANLVVIGGRIVSLSGHLGSFRAHAATGGGAQRDMGAFSPNSDGAYDLVLDLSAVPLIRSALPPRGYFSPRSAEGMEAAMSALPLLVGAFQHPRSIEFRPSLCTHSRQGVGGCSRCIGVCDAAAIRSIENVLCVDASLCQGCAACALACPTGAVTVKAPSPAELLERLHRLLIEASCAGVQSPVLLVHVPADASFVDGLRPEIRGLQVPVLPAFGDELWLAALAAGAAGVLLLDDEALTPGAQRAIEDAVVQTRALAAAAGRADAVIALARRDELAGTLANVRGARPAPRVQKSQATSGQGAKRQQARAALAQLSNGTETGITTLPAGASFGAVRLQRSACTLCLACVNLCPAGALRGSSEPAPRLEFNEAACVQCGLCAAGCAERALQLQPRAAGFSRPAGAFVVLAEDEMVRCTECRKPFIGRKVLARSLSALRAAAAFDENSEKLLYRCAACRARSLFG